jgi:murein DD-endopeptidase MepM/ murein hydrolase activator NlpD
VVKLRILLIAVSTVTIWFAPVAAHAQSGVPPVPGPIVRGFDPPAQNWQAGHRGIDVLAGSGTPVVAVLAGKVTFAAPIAGRGVIVVNHGDTRTTYEPVAATVKVGTEVVAGQQLGTLSAGHSCPGGSCLHLGWLRGSQYLDPSQLFSSGIHLLPANAAALATKLAAARRAELNSGSANGILSLPTEGAIGSKFGMRMHPIFHKWRLHAGVDIGGACGQPIRAAADGTVISRSTDSASGNRLAIDHGLIGGHRLITSYLHAAGYSVQVGQQVSRGQVVGAVGSTGWSTGCHLHFGVSMDGTVVDPQRFL